MSMQKYLNVEMVIFPGEKMCNFQIIFWIYKKMFGCKFAFKAWKL